MNRIIRRNYPVEKLPQDLRDGLPEHAVVSITVEVEARPSSKTVQELFDAVPDRLRRSSTEITAQIEASRDDWDRIR